MGPALRGVGACRRQRMAAAAGLCLVAGVVAVMTAVKGGAGGAGVGAGVLLSSGCERELAAAASALGWASTAAYVKNLHDNGQPVACDAVASGRPVQAASSALGATLSAAGLRPQPVKEHSSNIIKWMFGDLFDDHSQVARHPTALHLGGSPPKAHGVVRRADGSRVRRTAAERAYDEHRAPEQQAEADQDYRAAGRPDGRAGRGDELDHERRELRAREAHDERVEQRLADQEQEIKADAAAERRVADDDDNGGDASGDGSLAHRHHGLVEARARDRGQLAKATSAMVHLWDDKNEPVAQSAARGYSSHTHTRAAAPAMPADEVRKMETEARALGYKLVPAGLEAEAKRLGYALVPRQSHAESSPTGHASSDAPASTGGDGARMNWPRDDDAPAAAGASGVGADEPVAAQEMGDAQMQAAKPAKLMELAARDVERKMEESMDREHRSKTAKRLRSQAALETRLKIEFKTQRDIAKAKLHEQAARSRADEQAVADQTIAHYSHLLTFPDQRRPKVVGMTSRIREDLKDKAVEAARADAGKVARAQLSHYNLLTFDEDEFDTDTKKSQASKPQTPEEAAVDQAPLGQQARTQLNMPTALQRASQALAAARAQIAKDTMKLAAAKPHPPPAASSSSAVGAPQNSDGGHSEPKAQQHQQAPRRGKHEHSVAPASKASVEETETGRARQGRPMLQWDGKGIPRF